MIPNYNLPSSGKMLYIEALILGILLIGTSICDEIIHQYPGDIKGFRLALWANYLLIFIGVILCLFSVYSLMKMSHKSPPEYTPEDFESSLAALRKLYFEEHGEYPKEAEEKILWPELFAGQEKISPGKSAENFYQNTSIIMPDGLIVYIDDAPPEQSLEPIPTQNVNANETRNIHCENSAGEIIWRVKTSFDTSESGPFTGLWLENDVLKAQRQDGWVYNIDPKTGEGVLYLRTPC